MDEWELMLIAEDLEPGEYVNVVTTTHRNRTMMIVSDSATTIILKDQNGELHSFSRHDLFGKAGHITGRTTV